MPNKERFYDVRLTLKAGRMAEPSVIRVAERNDWFLNRMGNRKAEIYLDQWITPDEKTDIRYIEDPLTGLPFVTIRGRESKPPNVYSGSRATCGNSKRLCRPLKLPAIGMPR